MSGNSDSSATRALKVGGFTVLAIAALITCAAATVRGEAPLTSQYVQDWVDWPRTTPAWALVFGVGAALLLASVVGAVMALFGGAPKPEKARGMKTPRTLRSDEGMSALSIPASETLAAARGSLKFDTQTLSAPAADSVTIEPAAPLSPALEAVEPPSMEIHSLEPAIFDHHTELAEPAARFDPAAALSDTHGLQVASGAQVIPIRPEIQLPSDAAPILEAPALLRDPVEAALLADASATPRAAPPSDMNAVISSAMRFIETPADEAVAVERVEAPIEASGEASNTGSGFHEIAASFEPADDQAKIRQAVQTALSVWPDSTRAIAADELNVRAAYLYHDKAPQSTLAFNQIASGDLNAAAATLQGQADSLSAAGSRSEAAEVWRVVGALNMGRDDPKALIAYEKVSELDPSDANIHVYLARRYQMAGETAKQLPVLTRALAVVGDPATRLELLTPYADFKLKAGDIQAAGDAFEELSRLHETRTYLKPDDVPARSAQAISLAKLGQVREMQGAFDQAGQSYKKAHGIFADLSAMKPDHAGLKAMTENTQRDAQRLNA
jgi:Flp pilus assembly protein TadD